MAHPLVNGVAYTGAVAQKQLYGEGETAMGVTCYRIAYIATSWVVTGFGAVASVGDITVVWDGVNSIVDVDWSALETTYTTQPAMIVSAEINQSTPATARFWPQAKAISVSAGKIGFYNDSGTLQPTEDGKMSCLMYIIGEIG